MAERCSGALSVRRFYCNQMRSGSLIYAMPLPESGPRCSRHALSLEAAEHERRIGATESK
jgi:hypothetical protein